MYQIVGRALVWTHSETSVVLPYPAGATTRVPLELDPQRVKTTLYAKEMSSRSPVGESGEVSLLPGQLAAFSWHKGGVSPPYFQLSLTP